MSRQKKYKPGEEAEQDLTLYVKDADGNTLSEINVPKGHRIPPTREKEAEYYTTNQ